MLARIDGDEAATAKSDPNRLARLGQRLVTRDRDELGLEMEVTSWHGDLAGERSGVHDDLAALPFRLVVTSAHDPLMETALRQANKEPKVERYHYRGTNEELLPKPTAEKPVLFHLYGHAAEPRSLVLTEIQLLDFLAALISKNPPLPRDLKAELTNCRMFLFLGFGLDHWYLRILLHVLEVLRPGSRAFVLETGEGGRAGRTDDAILFYRENFRVDVQFDDVREFAHELRGRYQPEPTSPSSSPSPEPVPPPTAGAKVFICHASEDAARAGEVCDILEGADLEPWLDKESLRGGDRWDDMIESTIKQVDYFLVLNSRALAAKSRGVAYVNKEIKVALRADDLRMRSFIVPVRIDDEPLLEPLRGFHAVDLGGPHGERDLIRAIKRQMKAS
ncbi:MAG: TIR domain-containing protein [bacterium]|nr:TIR domain-containing protein [bacterium]